MDHVVRKKASLIVCFILMMTILCGCGAIDRITDGLNRKKEIETVANQMMQCIVDENKTKLLNLFSTDIQNNHANKINLELDRAFDFINGKIISYEYDSVYGESEKVDYGKVKYYDCNPGFLNVITDTGFKYEIWCAYTHISEKNPERVGISLIEIRNAENYNDYFDIGFFYNDYE